MTKAQHRWCLRIALTAVCVWSAGLISGCSGENDGVEKLTQQVDELEQRMAQLEERVSGQPHVRRALELGRQVAEQGDLELALVYLANGLNRAPGNKEVIEEVVRVAERGGDRVRERAASVLTSAVYAAPPDKVQELLEALDRVQKLLQPAPAAPTDVTQVSRELEELSEKLPRSWREEGVLEEARRKIDSWLSGWPEEGQQEVYERVVAASELVDSLMGTRDLLADATVLTERLEGEAASQEPRESVVGQLVLMANTRVQPILASRSLPEWAAREAENLLERIDRATTLARRKQSEIHLARLRQELDTISARIDNAVAGAESCRCDLCRLLGGNTEEISWKDVEDEMVAIGARGLPTGHPAPSGSPGPITQQIRSIDQRLQQLQVAVVPRIEDPGLQEKALEAMATAGAQVRRLEETRLRQYNRWALGILAAALYRYANDANWTNADAEELVRRFPLHRIDVTLLVPEAQKAFTYLLESAVFGEVSWRPMAAYRVYLSLAPKVSLNEF